MPAACLIYSHHSIVFPTEEQTHGEVEKSREESDVAEDIQRPTYFQSHSSIP